MIGTMQIIFTSPCRDGRSGLEPRSNVTQQPFLVGEFTPTRLRVAPTDSPTIVRPFRRRPDSGRSHRGHALWPAPAVLAKDHDDLKLANWIMSRVCMLKPKADADVQYYFSWAMHAHEYQKAHLPVFEGLCYVEQTRMQSP